MHQQSRQKSIAGQLLLLVVVLVDIGLIIWGWHWYQGRQAEVDTSGFDIARTPDHHATPSALPSERRASVPRGPESYVVKERGGLPGQAPSGTRAPGRKAAGASPNTGDSEKRSRRISEAVRFFQKLKRSPRFKNSKVIKEYKRDFHSYPDLHAVNERYKKDQDAIRLIAGTVTSPNFPKLVKKYLGRPDIQDFIKEALAAPAVLRSAGIFMENADVSAAAQDLGVRDMIKSARSKSPDPRREGSETRGRIGDNPALKKYLDREEAAPVPLR
ncbi:MAG: hypothetical protein ABII00_10450 [Elusimicrobiota bacterium]